jgi:hypothetical protein
VSFPYSEETVANIRQFRHRNESLSIQWNGENKYWSFDLTEVSVLWIMENLLTEEFQCDDEFIRISEEISEVLSKIEESVPMLVKREAGFEFVNVNNSVPQPENMNVIQAALLARRYGFNLWDETVSKLLETDKKSTLLTEFLLKTDTKPLKITPTIDGLGQFTDLINYSTTMLIVVPPDIELYCVKTWTDWLKLQNFAPESISVMFRLENANNNEFNKYIRDNNFNSPITERTRAVFVSQKISKPVIKANIDFGVVLNLGEISGAHYSLRNYLESCPDVIQYSMRV